MATNLFEKVEPTWRMLPPLESGYWILRFGEALEKHEDHQGENTIPHPLAGAAKIIETGSQTVSLALAAQGGDRFRKADLDAFLLQSDLQVSATVNWVVIRSVVENRPSIRENLTLEEKKEKKRARTSGPGVVKMPSQVRVKRGEEHSGTAYITVPRDPLASIYYVQYCRDNPTDEASWVDGGQADSCRHIEVKGLTPGVVYHFRVRCFGAGQYSPWSQVVTIRIL